MALVKNIMTHDLCVSSDRMQGKGKTTYIIKPGQVLDIPLSPGLKRLVNDGLVRLVKGGEILDIPGGLRHKLPEPKPPLRSLDEEWLA